MEGQKPRPSVRAEAGRSMIERCREMNAPSPGPGRTGSELHSGLNNRPLSGASL